MRSDRDSCITAAESRDWQTFLALAAAEGWRVPDNEIAFHRRPGMNSAFALRRAGATIGFVTAVRHQFSGWIGNLIITPSQRGNGHGARLFDAAVATLLRQGAQSLWLTASAQGAPLYLRRGFQPYGRVCRWVRMQGGAGQKVAGAETLAAGLLADSTVWQESRHDLLAHLSSAGLWLAKGAEMALLQQDGKRAILGPWCHRTKRDASLPLLEEIVAAATPGCELVLDLLQDHPAAEKTFLAEKFSCTGETLLMARGNVDNVRLERLYSLASLGSIG